MARTRCICAQGSFDITVDEVDLLERFLGAEIRQILARQQNSNAVAKNPSTPPLGSCETQHHKGLQDDTNT
jgi:hypothetical protein